jgi:hypothetical protein
VTCSGLPQLKQMGEQIGLAGARSPGLGSREDADVAPARDQDHGCQANVPAESPSGAAA